MIKKIALTLLAFILIIFVGYFLFFNIIGPALNDVKAAAIEKALLEIPLPPQTEMIETASYCGSTSHSGKPIEIWAGVLIRSKLLPEEIAQLYQDYEIVWAVPRDESIYPEPSEYMKFHYLSANGDRENCYIIAGHYTPVTQYDMRGD